MKRRLVGAAVLLAVLVLLYNLWPSQFPLVGAVGIIGGWLVSLWAAVDLVRLSRGSTNAPLLRDARNAVALAIGTTALAFVGFVTIGRAIRESLPFLGPLLDFFPSGSLLVLVAFGALMMAAPALNWVIYWHGPQENGK